MNDKKKYREKKWFFFLEYVYCECDWLLIRRMSHCRDCFVGCVRGILPFSWRNCWSGRLGSLQLCFLGPLGAETRPRWQKTGPNSFPNTILEGNWMPGRAGKLSKLVFGRNKAKITNNGTKSFPNTISKPHSMLGEAGKLSMLVFGNIKSGNEAENAKNGTKSFLNTILKENLTPWS